MMRSLTGLLVLTVAPGFAARAEPSLPLFFFPNTGQVDSSIRYVVETPDLRAGFQPGAAIFQIHHTNIWIRFAGANPGAAIEAAEPLPGKANFLLGDLSKNWKTGVPAYRKIVYRNLYPGIDLTYGGSGRRIQSEFLVAPGADPGLIQLDYSGADRIFIDTNGDLVAVSAGVELREEAPHLYQETTRGRADVAGRYRMLDARTVGFEIGAYADSKPLVIDPVISFATYLGGSGLSAVNGLAVDSTGSLYVTGWTETLNFPIAGSVQPANQGGVDAFIVKMNPAGTAFVYATYIGGRGDDQGAGIAVDASGEAYVAGSTTSTNFPLVLPAVTVLSGARAAFALKLNAVGNTLLYSTYLGGTNYDLGNAIAVDGSGNAYIAGDTQSANFPVTGTVQPVLGGNTDAFVAKLTPAGALAFATFLGGASNEHAGGIAVDASHNIYVAGGTFSTNFPVAGAIQNVNGGSQNAFVTKVNSSGSAIVYSTYLGGNDGLGTIEQANAIAVDSSGNAYVAGVTSSTNFPVTSAAYRASLNGLQDAFVTEINAAGNALVYSTYLGGSGNNWGSGIAVDAAGNTYVAGYTSSPDFPTVNPVQATFNGLYDAFVSELSAGGSVLTFSTFYGGTGSDVANAIALDSNADIFAGGQTSSLDLPLQTPIQAVNHGGNTGWVARLGIPPQVSGGHELGYIDAAGDVNGVPTVAKSGTLYVGGWAVDTVTGAPVQSVTVFVDGSAVGTATLGGSRPDVAQAYNQSSYTNSGWNFQMSAATLSAGSHTVTATAAGPSGTGQLVGSKSVSITAQPGGQELGHIDAAGDLNGIPTLIKGGTLYVGGWAVDTVTGAPVQSVTVFVDGSSVGTATLGGSRPDVAQAYNQSSYTNSGWNFQMSTATLTVASHTVTATAAGQSGTAQLAGSRTVSITAPPGGQELGNIDAAGDVNGVPSVVKGGTLYVGGWAVDTVTGAPVQSVTVFVDGSSVGTAALGGARPDVAQAYNRSSYTNSGWNFQMSTANLTVASHTVTATAAGQSGTGQLVGSKSVSITAQPGGQELGHIDAAGDVNGVPTLTKGGTLHVGGWAADTVTGAPVQSVTVFVDGSSVGTATLGGSRPDVAQAYNQSSYTNSGWNFQMSTATLTVASHTVTATAAGQSGTAQLAGSKSVSVTAPPGGQELGYVDAAGDVNGVPAVVQGGTMHVGGWAVDTVTGAPVQSVTVFVDGSSVGTATLGAARPDVAQAYNQSSYTNSGWNFQMSTASLTVASHTVTAVAAGQSGTAQLVGIKTVSITASR